MSARTSASPARSFAPSRSPSPVYSGEEEKGKEGRLSVSPSLFAGYLSSSSNEDDDSSQQRQGKKRKGSNVSSSSSKRSRPSTTPFDRPTAAEKRPKTAAERKQLDHIASVTSHFSSTETVQNEYEKLVQSVKNGTKLSPAMRDTMLSTARQMQFTKQQQQCAKNKPLEDILGGTPTIRKRSDGTYEPIASPGLSSSPQQQKEVASSSTSHPKPLQDAENLDGESYCSSSDAIESTVRSNADRWKQLQPTASASRREGSVPGGFQCEGFSDSEQSSNTSLREAQQRLLDKFSFAPDILADTETETAEEVEAMVNDERFPEKDRAMVVRLNENLVAAKQNRKDLHLLLEESQQDVNQLITIKNACEKQLAASTEKHNKALEMFIEAANERQLAVENYEKLLQLITTLVTRAENRVRTFIQLLHDSHATAFSVLKDQVVTARDNAVLSNELDLQRNALTEQQRKTQSDLKSGANATGTFVMDPGNPVSVVYTTGVVLLIPFARSF